MSIDELKARKKELQRRKKEELELQLRDEGDNLALFMVEEELLEVSAQIRALTPGARIGGPKRSPKGSDYNFDRKQFQDWLEEDRNSAEDEGADIRSIMQEILTKGQSLMTDRQWEAFSLWTTGMSMQKIADQLGIDRSVVSRLIGRAKAGLQEVLTIRNLAKDDLENISLDMSDPAVFKAIFSCITETQIVYLYLYFGEYLSCGEIANLLGCNHSTVSRTLHRGLKNISRSFAVPGIRLKNMDVLGEIAYQFYVTHHDLDDPPESLVQEHPCGWGRMALREKFWDPSTASPQHSLCTARNKPKTEIEDAVFEAAIDPCCDPAPFLNPSQPLSQMPQSLLFGPHPPRKNFGKLVSALLERKRRYQKYTQRQTSPIRYWLEQIFRGLSKWWGRGK